MSRHHVKAKWASIASTLRPRLAATLPRPCLHCGKPVLASQRWDVAHVTDLARGGDASNVGVAHSHCNRSAGGKLGAAMARAPRAIKAGSAREAKW